MENKVSSNLLTVQLNLAAMKNKNHKIHILFNTENTKDNLQEVLYYVQTFTTYACTAPQAAYIKKSKIQIYIYKCKIIKISGSSPNKKKYKEKT